MAANDLFDDTFRVDDIDEKGSAKVFDKGKINVHGSKGGLVC